MGNNVTVLPDTVLHIDCPVSGVPEPAVTWSRAGQQLTSGGQWTIHPNNTLTVHGASLDSSALYTCLARSIAGEDQRTTHVSVVGRDLKCLHF